MDESHPFDLEHRFVREADELTSEVLSAGDEGANLEIKDILKKRRQFRTIIDEYALKTEVPGESLMVRFCRGNGCALLDLGTVKIGKENQLEVEGLPAILLNRTPWGAMTFVTPVPNLEKTGAGKALLDAYGGLAVSFAYTLTTGFLAFHEKLKSLGKYSGRVEPLELETYWRYLLSAKLVEGEFPGSRENILKALPRGSSLAGIGVDKECIVATLTKGAAFIDFTKSSIEEEIHELSPRVQKHYGITPLSMVGGMVTLACERPLSSREKSDISRLTRSCYLLADHERVRQAITDWEARKLATGEMAGKITVDDGGDGVVIEEIDITELVKRSGEENPTVVELVQSIIVYGVQTGATDLHISPHPNRMWVRFRIDGFLTDYPHQLDQKLCRQVISRIKVMSNIDTQYAPRPQDGKFSISFQQKEFDVRVNTAPTIYGEKAILRFLPKRFRLPTLEDLGFLDHEKNIIHRVIGGDHGMLVICGPTGAGKSTTLSASIGLVDSNKYSVVTGEQPVETRIPNVEQTNVTASLDNPNGLTFARFLEAALRQDPDYIMIGETRDVETASQVVRAALTGHVVLTTLHTNSAAAAAGRLIDLGVAPFLLKEGLSGVVAQRLLPRLCTNCSIPADEPTDAELIKMGISREWFRGGNNFLMATGCAMCRGTGYSGRIGIFEGFLVDPAIRKAIGDMEGDTDSIREAMKRQGGRSLFEQACYLYGNGQTDAISALTMRTEDEEETVGKGGHHDH